MTYMNVLTYILRIQITINKVSGNTHVCQERYIEYVLKWFNMENCKSIANPLDINSKTQNLDQSPLTPKEERRHEKYNFNIEHSFSILFLSGVFSSLFSLRVLHNLCRPMSFHKSNIHHSK
jgi:hypothetical protein